MSSDSEEEALIVSSVAAMFTSKKCKRKKPRFWVNNYLKARTSKGRFTKDFQDLRSNPDVFKENFHMTCEQFDNLLELLKAKLQPIRKTRPDCLTPTEKLAVTLEYLASGSLERHIASCYRISKQCLGRIVESTSQHIFDTLEKTLPITSPKSKSDWVHIANEFNVLWNFPNCVGAIDGKHCAISCPSDGGSLFYCYKGFHSVILMGVADANCSFLYFDIGAYKSEGDSGVFASCAFGRALFARQLNLPDDQTVYGKKLPFAFLADDAFPLDQNILKPFKPVRKLDSLAMNERIFNYRLSRARRCIENAFGIMCARWQCLSRTMFCHPVKAQKIVGACCHLHNYLMKTKTEAYCPPGLMDTYDNDGNLILGYFRKVLPSNSLYHGSNNQSSLGGRPPKDAVQNRDHLKIFFNSQEGELNWQLKSLFLAKD